MLKLSKTLNRTRLFVLTALLLVFGVFLYRVFSTVPFLQHEIVGHSFWWNQSQSGFLETLFDGRKMDGWPGRFRYVEYLAEATYWKLMRYGFLPKDLYDFFGLVSVLVISFLLFQTAKKKNLRPLEAFLCVSFFILSSHAFLITVFHFRKAKALVAILFACLFWLSSFEKHSRLKLILMAVISFLGFFTDPFFILGAPVFLFFQDLSRKNFQASKAVLGGLVTAFCFLFVINGVVGPLFNENTKIIFRNFEGRHPGLLDFEHILSFPRVLQELLMPGYILETDRNIEVANPGTFTQTSWLGWLLVFSLTVLLYFQTQSRFREWGFTLGLLLALPVCAFLILPVSVRASYSGYYGYPFIVGVTVFLMNFILFLKTQPLKQTLMSGYALILLLIVFHQTNSKKVYDYWVTHTNFPYERERIDEDYKELKKIASFLKNNRTDTYNFYLDTFNVNSRIGTNLYFGPDRKEKRTDIAYFMVPLIFSKEIEEGRVKILLEDYNTSAVKESSK